MLWCAKLLLGHSILLSNSLHGNHEHEPELSFKTFCFETPGLANNRLPVRSVVCGRKRLGRIDFINKLPYGDHYFKIVIIDNHTGIYYVVPRQDNEYDRLDFSAEFSPDGKYIVFIRSGELYRKKIAPCGDLWLIELKSDITD